VDILFTSLAVINFNVTSLATVTGQIHYCNQMETAP